MVGWFLFAYKGYEDDNHDDMAGNLACLFALSVALFPNNGPRWESILHFVAAAGFVLVLAYFSLALFTKGAASPTSQKRTRNRVYVSCGVTILACIGLIGSSYLLLEPATRSETKIVFWLETLALWAFGFSWFVKGETLWRDP